LQLAPNQLEAHEALFDFYARQGEDAQAERAARELLRHFPDHLPTLEALANLRGHQGDHAESVRLLQLALKVNPLDRSLRSKLGTAHLFHARDYVEAGRFDEARAEYQTVLTFRDGKDESSVYCKWAACEFKAGDSARAEELLQKALADAGNRLAVAFSMVIEIIRLKLPRTLKTRFDKEFNAGLAEPPIGQSAAAIAETASAHRLAGITYHGQKTHEKKVLTYLEKALKAEFTEEQLQRTCTGLLGLEAHKLLLKFTALGKRRFPANPQFYFQEAESYFAQGPNRCPVWKVQPLLAKARELTQRLPRDDKQKALLELIEQREQMLGAGNILNNPHARGMLEEMIQIINPEFDDFDEEDEADFDYEDDF